MDISGNEDDEGGGGAEREEADQGRSGEHAVPGLVPACALLPVGAEVNAVILLSAHPQAR